MLEEFTIDANFFGIVLAEYGLAGTLEVQDIVIVGVTELKKRKVLTHPAVEAERRGYNLDCYSRLLSSTD